MESPPSLVSRVAAGTHLPTRRAARAAILLLGLVGETHAVAAGPATTPPPLLPMLPSVARVRVEVARAHVVVEEDVSLPRGAYAGGPLELFIAFAAPGAPLAIDAHLLPVGDGALEAAPDAVGPLLVAVRAPRRPASAHLLLGSPTMAGIVVTVPEGDLRRALAPGGMAALRLRYVVALPEELADGAREVLIRLGAAGSTPLTLGRLQIASSDASLRRVEARLCGPDADPYPLSISIVPSDHRPPPTTSAGATATPALPASPVSIAPLAPLAPIAPVLAVRHVNDDLCVRFWTAHALPSASP